MILKKVLFPIFISILFFSCDSNFSSKGKYDEYTNLGLEYFNAKSKWTTSIESTKLYPGL